MPTSNTAEKSAALTATHKTLEKMYGSMAPGAVGTIPIFAKGQWEYVFNSQGLVPGAENCADPQKVEILRQRAANVINAFPETIDALTKAGYRSAKSILTKSIKTADDVKRWADSIFNWGPGVITPSQGAIEAEDLAYDDFIVRHNYGFSDEDDSCSDEVFVVPEGPRGSGCGRVEVIHAHPDSDFGLKLAKGGRVYLGPRHELTKAAFANQGKTSTAKAPEKAPEAPVVPQEAPKADKAGKVAPKASTDLQAIRTWAGSNGFRVGNRGRIPAEVITAYNEANGTPTTPAAVPKAPQKPAKVTKKAPVAKTDKEATKAPASAEGKRPRGRPRADGLVSGSPEAMAADAAKKAAARATKGGVTRAATKKLPDSAVAKMEAAQQAQEILAAEPAKRIGRTVKKAATTNVVPIGDAPRKRVIRRASAPASA